MLTTLDQINANPQIRLSSGFSMLDRALGEDDGQYGFVVGGMYYLFGEPGVGKSRLSIQIMENLAREGKTSMVCQGEADLNAFAGWAKGKPESVSQKMYLTDDMDFHDLMDNIKNVRPSFVVIDSANMVNGISGVKDIQEKYIIWKNTVVEANTVCVLLGQLNKDGTLKGNTTVPHLVDCVGTISKPKIKKGYFKVPVDVHGQKVEIGMRWGEDNHLNAIFRVDIGKNRYGESGHVVDFAHNPSGVQYVTSSFETDPLVKRWLGSVEEWVWAEFNRQRGSTAPAQRSSGGVLGKVFNWLTS